MFGNLMTLKKNLQGCIWKKQQQHICSPREFLSDHLKINFFNIKNLVVFLSSGFYKSVGTLLFILKLFGISIDGC